MSTEDLIVQITNRIKNSFHISKDQHKGYYESAEGYLHDKKDSIIDIDKCIKKDTIWECQAYPNTPIGFYVIYGSELNLVLKEMLRVLQEGE